MNDEAKKTREAAEVYSVDVSDVASSKQPLIIEKEGEPIAAIVPFDEYQRFSIWREERAARRLWVVERDPRMELSAEEWQANFEAMDRFAAYLDVTVEDLQADFDEAIAAVRVDPLGAGEQG